MRVLLDECLPRKLKFDLRGHEVHTAQDQGWAGLKNGALLQMASRSGFDVFLAADRNIQFQQNLTDVNIAIVAMVAGSNRLRDLRPIMAQVREALTRARPGTVTRVGGFLVREPLPVYRAAARAVDSPLLLLL
jgi:hypothetical protein